MENVQTLISIDCGKTGAISFFEDGHLDFFKHIPIIKIIDKPAKKKFKYRNPNIVIKSGDNKGKRQKVAWLKEEFHTILDIWKIEKMLQEYPEATVVIEQQLAMSGNKDVVETLQNYGQIVAVSRLNCHKVQTVAPSKWKSDLGLSDSSLSYQKKKVKAHKLAHKLFDGWKFPSHDVAESALIGYHHLNGKI